MTESDSTRFKCCEHCRTPFTSVIAKARYCSDKCQRAHYRMTKQYGPFTCDHCYAEFYRRDSRRDTFCSRACNFNNRKMLQAANAQRKAEQQLINSLVRHEARALACIAKTVSSRTVECNCCGTSFIRGRRITQLCSAECRQAHRAARKRKYRVSPAGRAYNAKRKAIERGCDGADRIDPIKVFERDKWRCHLCGAKTPKNLRGTADDRAPELEHIVSLADGGSHTWGNVACSCRLCNQAKGSASFDQLGLGFAV